MDLCSTPLPHISKGQSVFAVIIGVRLFSSPYRLYRPYQLEIPQTTFLRDPSALYRSPKLDILSEINRRARRLERIVSYQKILAIIQMLFSLLLVILETTKILLAWEHFKYWEQKFVLMCEIAQPIFFVAAAFATLYCVLRPSKCTSQIAIASLIATLAPIFMFPSQSPFVLNAVEAAHLGRLMERSAVLGDDLEPPKISLVQRDVNVFERVPRLMQLPVITYTTAVGVQDEKVSSTSSSSSSATSSLHSLHRSLSLQYLLIAYAFFSFAYSILLVLTLILYVQLVQLQ